MRTSAEERKQLAAMLADFRDDPYGYVMTVYPWGEGDLRDWDGPDAWQEVALKEIGRQLKIGVRVVRIAVSSGHGVGKSAFIAWIIDWFTSCYHDGVGVVTANTKTQLTTKTWRELNKWNTRSRLSWLKEWTSTAFKNKANPAQMFAQAVPWSKENAQAFAGTHEDFVLMAFDEASNIDDIIWETAEGAMTTRGLWIAFGNPMKPGGRFSQCWTKFRKRWTTLRVDSRNAKAADKRQIEQWKEDYGIDSDFFRSRVMGLEAKSAPMQLISGELFDAATRRAVDPTSIPRAIPRIMGVDVARQGDDDSVIVRRHGRYMLPLRKTDVMHITDLMKLADRVAMEINDWRPDLVYVDATGMGAGVYDRLIQKGYSNVVAVVAAERAMEFGRFHNVRMEIWWRMKEWLATASVPDHAQLREDITSPTYAFTRDKDRMILESKADLKKRTGRSPDIADALAFTFAEAIPVRRDDTDRATEPDVP